MHVTISVSLWYWITLVAFVITFVQIVCRVTGVQFLPATKWLKNATWYIVIISYIITALAMAHMFGIK